MKYAKIKETRGITLIVLIITIIILIILSGVIIITLTGENGIIERAKTAREKNKYAIAEEMEANIQI